MESRCDGESRGFYYGSSESRGGYGESRYYGFESASESRIVSESREIPKLCCSSESRDSGESRKVYVPAYPPYGGIYETGESRVDGESREETIKVVGATKAKRNLKKTDVYQSLESIDELLERLDVPLEFKTDRMSSVVNARTRKIQELRELRSRIEAIEQEDKVISKLEEENSELDKAINALKKRLY